MVGVSLGAHVVGAGFGHLEGAALDGLGIIELGIVGALVADALGRFERDRRALGAGGHAQVGHGLIRLGDNQGIVEYALECLERFIFGIGHLDVIGAGIDRSSLIPRILFGIAVEDLEALGHGAFGCVELEDDPLVAIYICLIHIRVGQNCNLALVGPLGGEQGIFGDFDGVLRRDHHAIEQPTLEDLASLRHRNGKLPIRAVIGNGHRRDIIVRLTVAVGIERQLVGVRRPFRRGRNRIVDLRLGSDLRLAGEPAIELITLTGSFGQISTQRRARLDQPGGLVAL